MTFDEFVKTYNGKKIDYDKAYGVQCVDLAKLYIDKVLEIKPQSIGNAEAYWNRYNELPYLKNNFDRIANTPKFIPQKGDLVVWGLKHGKYGHIAIADGVGTTSYFYSYDENWGGKGQGMTRIKHNYKGGFEGVLRPKAQNKINGDKTSKYEVGQDVEIDVPIVRTGAKEGQDVLVDDMKGTPESQFWINETVINEQNHIHARTKICYIRGKEYMVQVFDRQFWIEESNIIKKIIIGGE